MAIKLNPYLAFDNNACREAMEFYQSVFGGDLNITTFAEASPEGGEGIMHAILTTDDLTIMASDGSETNGVHMGDNVSMSLSGDNSETLTKYFNGLSAGGKITLPLSTQVWGDTFGMFVDKFGIYWMVNITTPKA